MYEIEKNVPLADKRGADKYPFAAMEVGDSFTIPKTEKASKSISAAARSWAIRTNRPDYKFSMRTNGASVRLWRTA